MTVGVYGLVAGIVKLDDVGLNLSQKPGPLGGIGRGIVTASPWLMKGLSVVGTAAMFLVGGGIVAHGIAPLEHVIHDLTEEAGAAGFLVSTLLNGLVGIAVGAVVLASVTGIKRGLAAARGHQARRA
jgi:predicted DNA repair protein MutK